MTADVLPPVAQLKVVEEDQAVQGRDFFDAVAGETLFDTPCAIARVARSVKYERRMVVSAEASRDLKEKPLTYHWAVLRGDPERVRITPQNAAGSVAEIKVAYHERRPIEPGSPMESSRVDVGVFVRNGTYYSAPAFVSILFLDNEVRTYDDQKRIAAVDYAAGSQNYADPLLTLTRNWRDEYQYDPAGRLLGWTRTRGDAKERFTADGALVTKTDDQDRPVEAKRVRYVGQGAPGQVPALQQQTTDEVVRYEYASPDDRVGRVVEPAK
jgi:YD repeat-containing protein